MKAVLDLTDIIDLRTLSVIGLQKDKTEALYGLVKEGLIREVDEGKERLYPGEEHALGNFNRVRRNLEKRLINTLLGSDLNRSKYLSVYFATLKKSMACDALVKCGKPATSAQLAREALGVAEKYHFTELAATLARQLSQYYAVIATDRRQYRKYASIRDQYTAWTRWENRALDCYNDVVFDTRLAKSITKGLIQKVKAYKAELDEVSGTVPVLHFQLLRLNIHLILHKILNDIEGVERTCREGIRFISQLKFTPPPRAQRTFHFNLIPALLQSGDYEATFDTISYLKPIVEKGGHNYVMIHTYQVILGFHWQRLDIVRKAIHVIYKSKFYRMVREELRIYETYLALLEGAEQIKLGKFLNETPHYSADKKGMNINILIVQLLVFLHRNDRPAIIDRMEALQAYAYRYLAKDPTTHRSQLFFRMLFLLAKSAFEPEEVERRSPGITEALHKAPRFLATVDIEVVPYEVLWQKVRAWC